MGHCCSRLQCNDDNIDSDDNDTDVMILMTGMMMMNNCKKANIEYTGWPLRSEPLISGHIDTVTHTFSSAKTQTYNSLELTGPPMCRGHEL